MFNLLLNLTRSLTVCIFSVMFLGVLIYLNISLLDYLFGSFEGDFLLTTSSYSVILLLTFFISGYLIKGK